MTPSVLPLGVSHHECNVLRVSLSYCSYKNFIDCDHLQYSCIYFSRLQLTCELWNRWEKPIAILSKSNLLVLYTKLTPTLGSTGKVQDCGHTASAVVLYLYMRRVVDGLLQDIYGTHIMELFVPSAITGTLFQELQNSDRTAADSVFRKMGVVP